MGKKNYRMDEKNTCLFFLFALRQRRKRMNIRVYSAVKKKNM